MTFLLSELKKHSNCFPRGGPIPTLCLMYGTILSVLLMGMAPMLNAPLADVMTPPDILSVAAPTPVTEGSAPASGLGRRVSASGMLVVDLQSGQNVYGRDVSHRRAMGSLTKLMTALIIVENHALDEHVTVPADIGDVEGSSARLPAGATFTVGDLLSGLLMASGNDAARTLALYHSGSEAAFVRQMNARARELGLQDTSFANSAGLDHPDQWSTPRDIGWLATFVWRQPAIRERMSTAQATIRSIDGRTISLSHTHELLHETSTVVAGKTGTTTAARECLLSVVKEGDREYLVVLLGSRGRYTDMRALLKTLGDLLA